jgi:hypothetical protein
MPAVFKQSLTAAVLIDIATVSLGAVAGAAGAESAGALGAGDGLASSAAAPCAGRENGSSSSKISCKVESDKIKKSSAASTLSPAAAVELLGALCSVPRFDMALMCCTSKQKEQLLQAWDVAEQQGKGSLALGLQGRLAALRSKFKV